MKPVRAEGGDKACPHRTVTRVVLKPDVGMDFMNWWENRTVTRVVLKLVTKLFCEVFN